MILLIQAVGMFAFWMLLDYFVGMFLDYSEDIEESDKENCFYWNGGRKSE